MNKNRINDYFVLPDGERVSQSDRNEFIREVMNGVVNDKGYCPLKAGPFGGRGFWDKDYTNEKIVLRGYEKIPDSRWEGRDNPCFQKVKYSAANGQVDSMIVHVDMVNQHPNVEGLEGFVIERGLLIKKNNLKKRNKGADNKI